MIRRRWWWIPKALTNILKWLSESGSVLRSNFPGRPESTPGHSLHLLAYLTRCERKSDLSYNKDNPDVLDARVAESVFIVVSITTAGGIVQLFEAIPEASLRNPVWISLKCE